MCMQKFIKQVAQRATIAHLSPMCQDQISFQKIRTHPSFNACSCYMKVSKGSNQKQQRKSGNIIFPIISLWGYFLDAQGQLTLQSVVRSSGRNSNSSKILCMSSLPASLKRIRSIATEKKWWRQFFRRWRAANSIVSGGIWPKFKLIQDFMHVLITCKYEKDPIKNSRENVMT